jgi:alkylhydroperoxidase family enzyme
LSETFLAFSDMLAGKQSRLDPKLRELLILRVAWRTGSGYEWNQHSRMGGDEGLTDAQLRAVRKGHDVEVWTPLERALLTAVDEMIDRFAVSDETWNQLSMAFDAGQLLELLFVVGGYLCLATVLNSAGLRGNLPADKVDEPGAGSGAESAP